MPQKWDKYEAERITNLCATIEGTLKNVKADMISVHEGEGQLADIAEAWGMSLRLWQKLRKIELRLRG